MKKRRQVYMFIANPGVFESIVQNIRNLLVKEGGTLVREECFFHSMGKDNEQLLLVIVYNSNPDVKVTVDTIHDSYILSDAHVHSFEPQDITGYSSFFTVAGPYLDHAYSLLIKTSTSYTK